jgi:hypothetical protein
VITVLILPSKVHTLLPGSIPERENETNGAIRKLGKDIGVDIHETDISVSHRLGPLGPRPIICKFTRRDTKSDMMRAKKQLRDVLTTKMYTLTKILLLSE